MNECIAIIASIWFYIFPLLTGRALLGWFKRERSLSSLLEYYMVGGLSIYGVLMAMNMLHIFTASSFYAFLLISTAVVIGMNGVLLFMRKQRYINYLQVSSWLLPILVIVASATLAFTIWHWDVPRPMLLNWDAFEHQTLVNAIQRGSLSVMTSRLSDTFQFDGYSTFFHVLLTIPQRLFRPDPLYFWWFIEYVHAITSALAVYVLAYTVTKNRFTASLSTLIGALTHESYVAYASFFLVPQTYTAVLFALVLAYVVYKVKTPSVFSIKTILFLGIAALFILLNHYIVGTFAVGLLIGTAILYWILKQFPNLFLVGLGLLPVFTYICLYALSFAIPVAQINGGEALQYVYTTAKLQEFMQVFFGYALFILLPLGIIGVLRNSQAAKRVVSILTLIIIAVTLSGIPYALKFYVVGHYMTALLMGIGITWLTKFHPTRLIKIATFVLVGIWFSCHLILNAVYWKNDVRYQGVSTHISTADLEAVAYLKTLNNGKILLVSDPATQYALEAFSGVNSQGGAYMNKHTRTILNNFLHQPTQSEFMYALYSIKDTVENTSPDRIIIAFSGRFFRWIETTEQNQLDVSFNIWAPVPLSASQKKSVEEFVQKYNLTILYQNTDMVLVELNRMTFTNIL